MQIILQILKYICYFYSLKKNHYIKKEYQPNELLIIDSYRFEGMTNPGDQSTVFAIEAKDGTKGTMVMSYSASHGQNEALIQQIPYKKD